jgi:hypothetical protein
VNSNTVNLVIDSPGFTAALVGAAFMFFKGTYSYVTLGFATFHAATLLCLGLGYLLLVRGLRRVEYQWRPPVAAMLLVLSAHLYDSIWGIVSLAFRGGPLPLGGFLGAGIATLIIWRLDRKMDVVRPNLSLFALFTFMVVACLVALGRGGYYDAMTLYDAGLGPDPNMNPLWLMSKVFALLSPVYLVNGRVFGVLPSD